MGMTYSTLHLYGVEKPALIPLLAPEDILREQNEPWLSVVPPHDPDSEQRLEKIAKRLTKQDEKAAALLFFYFDDDFFRCGLYRNGKRAASMASSDTWMKLAKQLDLLFPDETPSKALRYAPKCSDLEEQLSLFEETVGTAFFDIPEEEPRLVMRSDKTLGEIKARETELKKRPNRFKLTELPPEQWPEDLRIREALLKKRRPEWREYDLSTLLFADDMKDYRIPGGEGAVGYPFFGGGNFRKNLLLYDPKTGEHRRIGPLQEDLRRAVWQMKNGGLVVLSARDVKEVETENGRWAGGGKDGLSFIDPDGTERRRFEPVISRHQNLLYAGTTAKGVVTLLAPGINALVKADTLFLQIDGETGELLRSHSVPAEDAVHALIYVKGMHAFVYCRRNENELVILNEELEETKRLRNYGGFYEFNGDDLFRGSTVWQYNYNKTINLFDLRDGTNSEIRLEVPAFPLTILPDGRILGVNEKQNILTVFDGDGAVIARCKVPGRLRHVFAEDGRICISELRGLDTHGFIYDELFDETSTHVWRLDPAEPIIR